MNSQKIKDEIKTIAFYLPQFHSIPLNDREWGKGFTEWTNVKKAKPLFKGHYQPHVPHKDIGYYTLDNPEVMKKQVDMAKKYGLSGFCYYYYYYWFSGEKPLENPLKIMLKNKDIDMPFCLCWANENWTRRWDAGDEQLIMKQDFGPKDPEAFMKDLLPYFKDQRYIKIDGKPVLLVYRPEIIPEVKKVVKKWKSELKKHGIEDLFLICVQNSRYTDPRDVGFDAATEFAPDGKGGAVKKRRSVRCEKTGKRIVSAYMKDIVYKMLCYPKTNYLRFRSVTTSWDNTARREEQGTVFLKSSPSLFKRALFYMTGYTLKHLPKGKRFIFINAWNEWAEGAHLEPDQKYGYQYLYALRDVLNSPVEKAEKKFKGVYFSLKILSIKFFLQMFIRHPFFFFKKKNHDLKKLTTESKGEVRYGK